MWEIIPTFAPAKPKYMKKYLIVMALASLMVACGEKTAERSVHSVMTVKPEQASEVTERSFAGVVKENAESSLGFRTGGTIEQILVKEGDHVRQGQLLARLDAKDYQLQVNAVQIQHDQLKAEVERLRLLYEGNSLSGNDYEKATSGLKQLAVQLQQMKNQLAYTRLYAPCDGYVQSVDHKRGETVGAGTPVVKLLDVGRMEVEVSIPQSIYLLRDRFGSIHCTANGGEYPLHLINIVPKADNSQLYTARLSLSQKLSAGQSVDVFISISNNDAPAHCTLPLSAIFEHEGKSCVWVVGADSTVSRKVVTIGGTDAGGQAVITSGLQGNETIVRSGVHSLYDKERVRIIEKPSATNVGGII